MIDEPFDLEGLPEPLPRKALRPTTTADAKVSWTQYKHRDPVHCDTCVAEVHAQWAQGGTHAPNRAVFRRSVAGKTTYWCSVHGMEQKQKDGAESPKRKKASTRR